MKDHIRILSINVERGSQIQSSSFAEATREEDPFNILLVQEPWWSNPETIHGPARSGRLRGWTPFLPKSKIAPHEQPRVHAYARSKAPIHIIQRFDMVEDLDIQILNVTFYSPGPTTVRLVNIYNQKPPNIANSQGRYAIETLNNVHFPPNTPTIFVGDWNTKHPRVCIMPEYQPTPDARARLFSDWMDRLGLHLRNEHNLTTRVLPASGRGSALDLTILNPTARHARTVYDWSINEKLNGGSDHYATSFSIGSPGVEIMNISGNVLNWKVAEKEVFQKALTEEKERDPERFQNVTNPIISGPPNSITREQIDQGFSHIMQIMIAATERVVKPKRPSQYANPWWDEKCSEALGEMRIRRTDAQQAKRETGEPDPNVESCLKHAQNRYKRIYTKTKSQYFDKIKEEATEDNIWELYKWGRGHRQYQSPPIKGADGVTVTDHQQKCQVLRTALLPVPPDLPHVTFPDFDPRDSDSPWMAITHNEVRDSISTAAPYNVPGPSGLAGIAWKWAFEVFPDELFTLIATTMEIGHHPEPFHDLITIILQKPDKPDYSAPKAYRPIQLLEVLGKVIERIQAQRIAYHLLKNNLISPHQLGGVRGRSAEDISLALVHDIESSLNRGMTLLLLTFDISGFFDNISHAVLLNQLRDLRAPLPTVKWVRSFLSNRRTAICLDGRKDKMTEIQTGVPQGSCVSPILACCLTIGLEDAIKESLLSENLPEDLKEEMDTLNGVHSPMGIYINDGALVAHSKDLVFNAKLLGVGRAAVEQWLNAKGLRTQPDKDGLIHFSRRHDQDLNPPVEFSTGENTHFSIEGTKLLKWLGIHYDCKLLFNKHIRIVAKKAHNAIASTNFLGNSMRGISQEH